MAINWTAAPEDASKITKIMLRASAGDRGKTLEALHTDRLTLAMDLTACHLNGCPLDLDRLLGASEADFAHDIAGIVRHLDRETGQLGDCFVPRCARTWVEA